MHKQHRCRRNTSYFPLADHRCFCFRHQRLTPVDSALTVRGQLMQPHNWSQMVDRQDTWILSPRILAPLITTALARHHDHQSLLDRLLSPFTSIFAIGLQLGSPNSLNTARATAGPRAPRAPTPYALERSGADGLDLHTCERFRRRRRTRARRRKRADGALRNLGVF